MLSKSYAKINIDLKVTGKRSDGYHNLDMIVTPIDLYDLIEIELLEQGKNDWQSSGVHVPLDEENLIIKAVRVFQSATFFPYGLKIRVQKNIPIQAGLGGGSSNAATTLKMLNQLAGFPLTQEKLIELASKLGADVPFFINPTLSIVRGKGEIIKSIASEVLNKRPITIIQPVVGSSTSRVFSHVKSYSFPVAETLAEMLINGQLEQFFASISNDLLIPAADENPIIERIYEDLVDRVSAPIVMTGSGSCIVIYDRLNDQQIANLQGEIPEIKAIFSTHILTTI